MPRFYRTINTVCGHETKCFTSPDDNYQYSYPPSNALFTLFTFQSVLLYTQSKCFLQGKTRHSYYEATFFYDIIFQDILSQAFDVIKSDVMLYYLLMQ